MFASSSFRFLVLLDASSLKNEKQYKNNDAFYKGAQVWRFKFRSASDRDFIEKLEQREGIISLWRLTHKYADFLVLPEHRENIQHQFRSFNLNYTVNVNDVQKNIDNERIEMEMFHRNYVNDTYWTHYHNLDEINFIINHTAIGHPKIVMTTVIGVSHEKRDIKLIRLSNGSPKNKAILIEGGIHAREWISTATVIYIMQEFIKNFSKETNDIRSIDWYFVPVLNPDGYNYSHKDEGDRLWRKNRKLVGTASNLINCYGVDLNRNFGYKWGTKGSSRTPCHEDFCGKEAFSEAESKAIRDFLVNGSVTLSAYLALHSYGQLIIYPWGYDNVDVPHKKELHALGTDMAEIIRNTSGYHYTVSSLPEALYSASGSSMDWVTSTGVKYVYTLELNDGGINGFILPSRYIKPVGMAILAAVRVLAAKVNKEANIVTKKYVLRNYTLLSEY